jgi:hypothetical protein
MEQNDVREILTNLAEAQVALRDSAAAFDNAMEGLTQMMHAIGDANRAQRTAINAVIAATNKALALVDGGAQ